MNISDEAVDAATKALYELERGNAGWRPFAEMPSQYIEEWRQQAKVALEAAAPDMLAQAWDRGMSFSAGLLNGEEFTRSFHKDNPYRSQE